MECELVPHSTEPDTWVVTVEDRDYGRYEATFVGHQAKDRAEEYGFWRCGNPHPDVFRRAEEDFAAGRCRPLADIIAERKANQ